MLTDPRIAKMAEVLIRYSLDTRPGDLLAITAQPVAAPLVRECYRQALLAGAHPHLDLTLPGIAEIFYQTAGDAQLDFVSPRSRLIMDTFDAHLAILSDVNTKALSGADPAKQARRQAAQRELLRRFMERDAGGDLRWSGAMYPTEAYAQDAELSLADLAEFIFAACLLNDPDPAASWRAVGARQQRLVDWLAGKREIRLIGRDTDLTLSIAGRAFINDDGKKNFPGGEIFTGPVEDSANGTIRFSFPAAFHGREVEDVRLRFAGGRVVEATAAKNGDLLDQLLGMDEGARRLGEFAFGLNPGVTRFTRNVLFDEKIAGTVHLALGASYPATGGRNESALHWDMVCDLRDGGEVYVDGELFAKDGRIAIES
ncbi:MAG TPA: aminopeptidase [Thermomicrobiales bacterium]|nr:aminopeptidase [Thermomicrobiales bacterium]